jgi:hypothetical protein
MTAADLSSSLNGWIHFAEFGCIVVIVGILGESVELVAKLGKRKDFIKWFSGRLNPRLLAPFVKLTIPDKLWIEGISLILVAVGLLIEVIASHVVYGISDLQNAELKQEAGDAMTSAAHSESNSAQVLLQVAGLNKEAADARVIAGAANERAANTESNNLVLQKELQPRIITMEQVTNFIFLTEKITKKIPIVVHCSSNGDEAWSFATQIRTMLDRAGFLRDSSQNGIETDADRHIYATPGRALGFTNEEYSVIFFNFSTNSLPAIDPYIVEYTNGFCRPIISEKDYDPRVYEAVSQCFNEIGIKAGWNEKQIPISGGESAFEIYIGPKIY